MRTNQTIYESSEYQVMAHNDQGASVMVADGAQYTSLRQAIAAARAELGKGWRVEVIDVIHHKTVEEFTIRK